jgi:hypothetical protein
MGEPAFDDESTRERTTRSRGRRTSNGLWLCVIAIVVVSWTWASRTCSFWYGWYLLASAIVALGSMAAVYARQAPEEKTVDLLFGLAMGIAAGFVTFYGVVACSLHFAHCGN